MGPGRILLEVPVSSPATRCAPSALVDESYVTSDQPTLDTTCRTKPYHHGPISLNTLWESVREIERSFVDRWALWHGDTATPPRGRQEQTWGLA